MHADSKTKGLGIVVLSCDAYSDLWSIFFSQLQKHWPETSDYNVYLACNEKSSGLAKVIDAKSGPDIDWSTSLIKALEVVKEENVLMLIEDAFFCEDVDHERFLNMYEKFKEYEMDYFRLKNSPLPNIFTEQQFGQISPGQLYRTALFSSIWKKTVLIDVIKPGETAWEFELKGSDRSDKYLKFYSVYSDMFKIIHGVIKGMWVPSAINDLKKIGISFDVERGILSRREVFLLTLVKLRGQILKLLPSVMRKKIRRFVYKNLLGKEWFS